MSSSYFVTYGTDRLMFGGSGSVAWEDVPSITLFNVTFGEGNIYSAGLTAEYNGNVIYSSPIGSAKRTATGIPSGSKITFCGSSPKYTCFTLAGITGGSAVSRSYDGQRDGLGLTATAYLTANGNARLANGHSKTFRVEGGWPKPGGNGRLASVYCKPTAFSSWFGTGWSAGSKLNIRNSWTANMVSHQGNSWGAGGDVSAPGWQPRNVSSNFWSGWCDTTGSYSPVYGYLETAGGFQTIGGHNSAYYGIARSWGETTNQNFYCAGRSAAGMSVITAINGWWWGTGIAP